MDGTDREILKEFYYSPETGFSSALNTWKLLKKKGYTQFTLKMVEEFIKNQQASQVHKQTKQAPYHSIVGKPGGQYQIDIMFFPRGYEDVNRGYSAIFAAIEVTSRKAFLIPMKDKSAKSVVQAFKLLLHQIKNKIQTVTSDQDSVFTGGEFKNTCLENKDTSGKRHEPIIQYFSDVNDHHKLGIIDSFIKTMKTMIDKYFTATNDIVWIGAIHKLVDNYNNRENSGIGYAPDDVTPKIANDIRYQAYISGLDARRQFNKFQLGDLVKYQLYKDKKITKGGKEFSKKNYVIAGFDKWSFILEDPETKEQLPKRYKYHQLQKVNRSEINVEKKKVKIDTDLVKEQFKINNRVKKEKKQLALDVPEKAVKPVREKRQPKTNPKYLV